MAVTVSAEVRLAAPVAEVWARVTTPEGVNDELRPWLRMTVPPAWRERSLADVEAPVTVGRSWLLLFGVLPFDADRIHLAAVRDHGFSERSTMLTASAWHHDRSLEDHGGGTVLRDELAFELRPPLRWVPGASALYAGVVRRIFRHRHARLVARFGVG